MPATSFVPRVRESNIARLTQLCSYIQYFALSLRIRAAKFSIGSIFCIEYFAIVVDCDQSRAIDETGYVQPTIQQLQAERGLNSIYHNNSIATWMVNKDGSVDNVRLG